MARSSKKGPYIDPRIIKKIKQFKEGKIKSIKTWARRSTISPNMVGLTVEVHNGKYFHKVFITESMVGHKLGEFVLTRRFTGHSKKGKIAKSSGSTGRTLAA